MLTCHHMLVQRLASIAQLLTATAIALMASCLRMVPLRYTNIHVGQPQIEEDYVTADVTPQVRPWTACHDHVVRRALGNVRALTFTTRSIIQALSG